MIVTLIIGNGFDLNMGLPTSYSDFYKYYLQVDSPKSTNLIKQEIGKKPRNWADLEKSLGEISKMYLQDSDAYIEAFENVRDELALYLKEVDRYEIPNLDTFATFLLKDVLEVDRFLDNKPKREYRLFLEGVDFSNEIELTVVNFNYTSTVEKMMAVQKTAELPPKKVIFKDVIHVHHDLSTGILMGVNDTSQIANEEFGELFDIQSMMVKPFINDSFAAGNDHKAYSALLAADVIILFGTSFGETDNLWWEHLKNAVYNTKVRIIYCPFENDRVKPMHETNVIRKIHYYKESLAKRLSSGNLIVEANLYSKIYPIRNNHLFSFGFTQWNRDMTREKIIKRIMNNRDYIEL